MTLPAVSRETEERFIRYTALLAKWQGAINLVGPDTLANSRGRHIDDSRQLLPYLPETPGVLFDLGSGAGFPGLVLAMLRPDLKVYLIESDQRKCAFLRTVSRETKTPAEAVCARIEQAAAGQARTESGQELPVPDIITARALAPLHKLLDYCLPWSLQNPDLVLLFLKGASADQEVHEAREHFSFEETSLPSMTAGSHILRITNLGAKR